MIISEQQMEAEYRPNSKRLAPPKKRGRAYLSVIFLLDPSYFLWPSPSKFPFPTGHEDGNDLRNQFTWKCQCLKSIHISTAKDSVIQRMTEKISGDKVFPGPVTLLACDMPLVSTHHHLSGSCLLRAQSTPHGTFQPLQGSTCWQKKQLTLIFLQAGNSHNENFLCKVSGV